MHLYLKTPADSPLHRELIAMINEQHSPSSKMILQGIAIQEIVHVGKDKIFRMHPHAKDVHTAAASLQEMRYRTPFLLDAIRQAAKENAPIIDVRIFANQDGHEILVSQITAHEELENLPILLVWMMTPPCNIDKVCPP